MSAGKKAAKTETSKEPRASAHPKHKMHAFWPPWAGGPLVLVLGAIGHQLWGRSVPAAAVVPLLLVLSTAGLSALTYTYAKPRTAVQRWHAVLSVAVLGLSLSAVQIWGTGISVLSPVRPPSVLSWLVLFLSSVLALSWNIRRFEVVRGSGQDNHGQDSGQEDWHGLKKPRSLKVTSSDRKQTQASVKLAPGQTAKDVEAALRPMGSDLGTITNGIRVEEGEKEGEVNLTMLWEDTLTDAVGWEGPEFVAGSIADPISLGVNEQGNKVLLYMAGDYDKGIAPGHVKVIGMPRTGKGIAALIIWANLRGRRDVFPVINDAAKSEQMLQFLRPGMPKGKAWIDKTRPGAKAQAMAIKNAMVARNAALGDAGFSSWTPKAFSEGLMWKGQRIHMPAIVFHLEEFAPIGIASPALFTEIAEQSLSSGIFLLTSLQRASHDRFPTSMRSLIGNGICYGAHDDIDVSFALPDEATNGGASPAKWGQKFPGRAMASLNGQPDGMERIPWKTHYAASQEEFEGYMKAEMAYLLQYAPDLDPCTAEAFGQAYTDYLAEGSPITTVEEFLTERDRRASSPAPVTSDDDEPTEEEDDEMDEDPNEAKYAKADPPAGCEASHIDPTQPLPDYTGPAYNITPPATPGRQTKKLEPAEKRALFREILQRLADEKRFDVQTGELINIWCEELGYPESNKSPEVSRFITLAAAEDLVDGKPNDLMGCLERGRRGKFRITLRPRVNA